MQLNNLADMKIDEDVCSREFRQLSRSFNQHAERLNNAFARAARQFHRQRRPRAAHAAGADAAQLSCREHPDAAGDAEFLTLLREQTERLTQMTKTLWR